MIKLNLLQFLVNFGWRRVYALPILRACGHHFGIVFENDLLNGWSHEPTENKQNNRKAAESGAFRFPALYSADRRHRENSGLARGAGRGSGAAGAPDAQIGQEIKSGGAHGRKAGAA